MSNVCELCGKSKNRMSKFEFDKVLKDMGKDWKSLDESTKILFKINKYTYTCDCPVNRAWELEQSRGKQ